MTPDLNAEIERLTQRLAEADALIRDLTQTAAALMTGGKPISEDRDAVSRGRRWKE